MAKTIAPTVTRVPNPYVMSDPTPKEGGKKFVFLKTHHPFGLSAYPMEEGYTAVECKDGLYQIWDNGNEKTFFRIGQFIIDKLHFNKIITPQQ